MDLLRSRFSFIWGAPLDDGPGAVFDADEVRALSAELLELSRVGASPERFRRVVAEHAGKLVSSLFFFQGRAAIRMASSSRMGGLEVITITESIGD